MLEQYKIIIDPISGSVGLSAIAAALALVTLFLLLGVLRMKAWIAGLISLAVALVVAVVVYGMPVGQALLSASEGAAFGFFPILWIVINAIWVYNLTVSSGHFDVLRRNFGRISPDLRIQAIIIAFCFGALLEALAGFGTPVAITVVMLMALGFRPIHAASVSLIANTAPVAFGALAAPITALATVTHGASDHPGLNLETLGAMVGRQTPVLSIIVPLVLVAVVDGKRGVRQTWPAALVAGVSFGVAQFVAANYISVPLTDIVASLVATLAVVLLLRVWRPSESPDLSVSSETAGDGKAAAAVDGDTTVPATVGSGAATSTIERVEAEPRDSRADVFKAYAPYAIVIALFSIANIGAVKAALAVSPWTVKFQWPGLDVLTAAGKPQSSMMFAFGWLPAAGTLMIFAGILSAIVLGVRPGAALKAYVNTWVSLRHAIVTVMAVLALAYVLNQSGQTNTLGAFFAGAGGAFVFLSSILGWIGVAVTGSDTSANALFGALQVQTAARTGLDPVLLAAANSSGGVMGKMISPQNLAIAAAAVGMAGREGEIFRKVLGWSLVLLLFMCILVTLQSTPILGWMVVK
ncbi:L-lactate permease [Planosporangium mesophilum]|uniref:L-lactate permease n=1 Tax=Planosporangium mesophilum TaxID=689768 RepID=A0A8J3THQ9_9ACTN|nr:L-lactate permease [Planosporangium mesophilum]GII25377.1 L-lactate permease [Planosporangium mesophilum]